MTYQDAVRYLNSLINYEKFKSLSYSSFKLGRIRAFLATIDSPQKGLKAIHIAGSNGKGSTCAFISYILREAGFKVGLFTSPHLSSFRERMRILLPTSRRTKDEAFEGIISKHDFCHIISRLIPHFERFGQNSEYGPLTFFEILTAIALVYFRDRTVDFAVVETGLGGRLDATNVVSPLLCVITAISLEHEHILGNTLAKITKEKAGIIKRSKNLIVISAKQQEIVSKVIRKRCKDLGVRLVEQGKDIISRQKSCSLDGERFDLNTYRNHYRDLSIRLIGKYQIANASLAVSAVEELMGFNFRIPEDSIRKGLAATLWPARLETIKRRPHILLDTAHNQYSAKALVETLKSRLGHKRLIMIVGISSDKNIPAIAQEFASVANHIILTRANNPRAAEVSCLSRAFESVRSSRKRKFSLSACEDFSQALVLAKEKAKKRDFILVAGSVFLAGDIRRHIVKHSPV